MPIITISPPLCALVAAPTSHSHWLVLVRSRVPQCLGAAASTEPLRSATQPEAAYNRGCSSRSLSLLQHGLVAGLVAEHSARWAGLSVGPGLVSPWARSTLVVDQSS